MFTGSDFADFLIGTPATSFLDNVQLDNDGRNYMIPFSLKIACTPPNA